MHAVARLACPGAELPGGECPGTPPFRPPAPMPREKSPGLIALPRALYQNPVECFSREHFEQWAVTASRALDHVVLLNEPAEVRANILTFIVAGHETTANFLI